MILHKDLHHDDLVSKWSGEWISSFFSLSIRYINQSSQDNPVISDAVSSKDFARSIFSSLIFIFNTPVTASAEPFIDHLPITCMMLENKWTSTFSASNSQTT